MRTLIMFIIGLLLTSCVSNNKVSKSGNAFNDIINTYRIKSGVKPLRWNSNLYKVTEEVTDVYVKKINSTHTTDTTTDMITTLNSFHRLTLPNKDGEISVINYLDGNEFDTLQINLFKDQSLPRLIKYVSPKTYNKLSTTISIGAQIGKNTYNVHSKICEGTYDYNGITINIKIINGKKVLWTKEDTNIKNRSVSCLKLNCLDNNTKNEVKMVYFLNQIIKNPKLKTKLLDGNMKSMSYKRIIDDSYVLFVMNIQ